MKNMKIPRITKLTELAGWDVPGADPGSYGHHKVEQPEEGMTFG